MLDLIDLHTHTLACGHAYNTLYEMVKAASEKGLKIYGCAEHAPAMPGSCNYLYFNNFKILPRTLYGIKIMMGAELNIIDYSGKVDLDQELIERLDFAVASLHTVCIPAGTVKQNTDAYLGVISNPAIQIIGHPDDGRYPADYDTLAAAAKENNKLIEVNNTSFSPMSVRKGARENYAVLLERCRHYGTSIIVDSDAHCCADVGNHKEAYKFLEKIDFPQELIVNTSLKLLGKFIPNFDRIMAQGDDERCGEK